MPMSAEARKAAGDRMRAMHAAKKSKENGHATEEHPPVLSIAKENSPSLLMQKIAMDWEVSVKVDWERIPMLEGQQAYAKLRTEFEKAGRILNARSLKTDTGFKCFMCGADFDGMPAFRDDSYRDSKTGLLIPVRICGQVCAERYNVRLFEERRDRSIKANTL